MPAKLEFNTAGPCVQGEHYMLDPMRGIYDELMSLIDTSKFFVIHAARQSGKSTLLLELTERINAAKNYYAVYCSLEALDGTVSTPEKGIPAIVNGIRSAINDYGLPDGFAAKVDFKDITGVLKNSLTAYCRTLDKPLVIFFDEADCLSNGALVSFLRQLRSGYVTRGRIPFVHSVALVGLRNIYDYKDRVRPESESMGGGSPFNIITESLNLRNFTNTEVIELYAQHTAQTGQVFEPQAVDYAFTQTQGQPWLVNAVAREIIVKILENKFSLPITRSLVEQAIQNLIANRNTHFSSLLKRLKDPRVESIMLSLVQGKDDVDRRDDDFQYVKELGLIKVDPKTRVAEPANPIYAEVIVRAINLSVQEKLTSNPVYEAVNYIKDGYMDINALLKMFQEYWRENSEVAWESFCGKDVKKQVKLQYQEATPHLTLQAFLQRVVNGGGQILREMALGKGRCDLAVVYGGHKYPIEIKIKGNEKSRDESLGQISDYADKCGSDKGWLVVFDRDTKKSWEEKLYMREEARGGKKITVVGC